MKKKLIISFGSYDWIKYCCGLILENSSEFEVIILYRESGIDGMYQCDRLCASAVEAQRKHDLARIGKTLGIKKLSNLNYGKHIDVEQLSMNLKLQSTLNGIDEIYYQYNKVLNEIMKAIGNTFGIDVYSYGCKLNEIKKEINTDKFTNEILEIKDKMIGISSLVQIEFPKIQKFY